MDEIHPELNRSWLRWKATAIEWLSVIIAGFALLVALFSHFEATRANVRSEMFEQHTADLSDDIAVWKIYASQNNAYMKAHGLKPPPLPEE